MKSSEQRPELISRREAILRVSAMLGSVALVGQGAMLAGCEERKLPGAGDYTGNRLFPADDVRRLDEIAETILPETATPGAKAAGVGPFIALMVLDTYDSDEQQVFVNGLDALEAACEQMHGARFMDVSAGQRLALLDALDREQFDYMQSRTGDMPVHYFRMLKELTLLGYFTSEVGYRHALRYAETPGRYDACAPYAPGERAWASHL